MLGWLSNCKGPLIPAANSDSRDELSSGPQPQPCGSSAYAKDANPAGHRSRAVRGRIFDLFLLETRYATRRADGPSKEQPIMQAIGELLSTGFHDVWVWLAALNYQEWFLLLGITSLAGFMCMRGFGSRADY